jgi:hypothetical protein
MSEKTALFFALDSLVRRTYKLPRRVRMWRRRMSRKRKGDEADRSPAADSPEGNRLSGNEPSANPRPQGDNDLVLVVHAANLTEGELFKSELEAQGIPAVIDGEGPTLAGVGSGVPVLVPEEFADQAAELIAELESAQSEGRTVAEKDDLFEEEEDEELESVDELDSLDDEDSDEDDEDLDDEDVDDDDWDEDEEDDEGKEEDEEEEEDDEDWDDDDDL